MGDAGCTEIVIAYINVSAAPRRRQPIHTVTEVCHGSLGLRWHRPGDCGAGAAGEGGGRPGGRSRDVAALSYRALFSIFSPPGQKTQNLWIS
eukprot:7100993-Prymnesium_polylepis.2